MTMLVRNGVEHWAYDAVCTFQVNASSRNYHSGCHRTSDVLLQHEQPTSLSNGLRCNIELTSHRVKARKGMQFTGDFDSRLGWLAGNGG